MESREHLFTVSIYSENQIGLLSVIANTFTRRSLNIEKLTALPSQFPGIHNITLQTRTTEERVASIVKAIEKKVEVIRAFYHVDHEYAVKEHAAVADFMENIHK